MRHNIKVYDFAPKDNGHYRNENFLFPAMLGSGILAAIGLFIFGLAFIPPFSMNMVVGGLMATIPAILNTLLILTHRNSGLSSAQANLMDELYRLPKNRRKEFGITRNDVVQLENVEAIRATDALIEYRKAKGSNEKVTQMVGVVTEYTKTYKEIEGH